MNIEANANDNGKQSERQAALLLYSISDEERNSILETLTPEQRAIQMQLLTELETLGIPKDATLLESTLGAKESATSGGVSEAAVVFRDSMRFEPPVLHALALFSQHAEVAKEALESLGEARRRLVDESYAALVREKFDPSKAHSLMARLNELLSTERTQNAFTHSPKRVINNSSLGSFPANWGDRFNLFLSRLNLKLSSLTK